MSPQEQITKLQGLLERIKKNASTPHASAPQRASAPVTFASPVAAAAPVFVAPPASAAKAAAAYADQSVDDLLSASPEPSPPPLEIDVALDSMPPAAEVAASPSQAPPSEPMPLVSSQQYASSVDEAAELDSEVSEVRVATSVREPAVEVTIAAIEAEAEPLDTEELSDDDLVEVTEGTPQAPDVDIDFEDEDEQPPASSQRSRIASSMDEALAAAADQLEAEREVPIQTPPPESGPQEAPMPSGLAAPPAPDVDALLGGELEIPTRDTGLAATAGPTTEQLGQTIDLEEARGPTLELAEHQVPAQAAAAVEELEVALPPRDVALGYDDNLQPPPEARDELEAHRRRTEEYIAPPPESLATLPSVEPGPAPSSEPAAAAVGPETIARPAPIGSPESFGSVRETFRPSSFAELLDASLALDGQ